MHELKPINLGKNELLYQQNDAANEIYFIQSGKVKLFVDLNDYVTDDHLIQHIQNAEKQKEENNDGPSGLR